MVNISGRLGDPLVGDGRSWAVITGATDGIGLSYARQLAHKRYNLLLISRSADKLEKVRNDLQVIQQPLNTTTIVLDIDFAINTDEVYDRIDRELQTMNIHVLINNVGMYCPDGVPRNFIDVPDLSKYNQDIINVNIIACTRLTALILPAMINRNRGVIINLSSFGATFPYPQLAVYSATKVYVDYFSRALEAECRHTGVVVQSVLPFFVLTKIIGHVGTQSFARLIMPTADSFVGQAIGTVGRQSRTAGHLFHRLVYLLNSYLKMHKLD
ncbi:unnamed protein product [Medioppia subpectinata]|uniref:Uncharacterized protein n=1 Tax=Medioppia subpectinata TaxID=1979941 RepID=A0A7R9KRS0_9ACAR|nr:unnamed protein product [Medioppia subpectinata]CAG2108646.1 unnamed protein product [Medioppia subpectinata]